MKEIVINKKPEAKKEKFEVDKSVFDSWVDLDQKKDEEITAPEPRIRATNRTMALHIVIDEEAHAQFKMYCIDNRMTMREKVEEMILELLKKQKK